MNILPVIEPRIFLVGAGPGCPGLLTVRAKEILERADLVLYDQLVSQRVLKFTSANAECICIRDLPATNKDKYPLLYDMMLSAARAGRVVVRLKGGDPLVFGRGAEEVEVLRESGLPYEVVPGVTAALAMAAYLDLPFTHRLHTGAVALVTGHEVPGRSPQPLDWAALAQFPGSLVIYMGMARIPLIVAELLRHGLPATTPACIAERVSTGEMRSVQTTVEHLESARRNSGLEAPGLIIIGSAAVQQAPSWYEQLPLFNRRVLVTRPEQQANEMIHQLEQLGAVAYHMPILQIRGPSDTTAIDTALRQLKQNDGGYDWLVFASANGVDYTIKRLFDLGGDIRWMGRVRLAAVGQKTAAALAKYHLHADVVPESFIAEALAEVLLPQVRQQRVLLLRANRGRNTLPELLSQVARVDQVIAYEQIEEVDTHSEVYSALRRGELEFITLSSSNTATALLETFDTTLRERIQKGEIKLVAMSRETAQAIEKLGLPVASTAAPHTAEGLVSAVCQLAQANPRSGH